MVYDARRRCSIYSKGIVSYRCASAELPEEVCWVFFFLWLHGGVALLYSKAYELKSSLYSDCSWSSLELPFNSNFRMLCPPSACILPHHREALATWTGNTPIWNKPEFSAYSDRICLIVCPSICILLCRQTKYIRGWKNRKTTNSRKIIIFVRERQCYRWRMVLCFTVETTWPQKHLLVWRVWKLSSKIKPYIFKSYGYDGCNIFWHFMVSTNNQVHILRSHCLLTENTFF